MMLGFYPSPDPPSFSPCPFFFWLIWLALDPHSPSPLNSRKESSTRCLTIGTEQNCTACMQYNDAEKRL